VKNSNGIQNILIRKSVKLQKEQQDVIQIKKRKILQFRQKQTYRRREQARGQKMI
jgi:hypothetical protein